MTTNTLAWNTMASATVAHLSTPFKSRKRIATFPATATKLSLVEVEKPYPSTKIPHSLLLPQLPFLIICLWDATPKDRMVELWDGDKTVSILLP